MEVDTEIMTTSDTPGSRHSKNLGKNSSAKCVKGLYHTSTPYQDKDFVVVLKLTRRGDSDEPSDIGATQILQSSAFVNFLGKQKK